MSNDGYIPPMLDCPQSVVKAQDNTFDYSAVQGMSVTHLLSRSKVNFFEIHITVTLSNFLNGALLYTRL